MPHLANVQQSVAPGLQRAPFLLPEKSGWLRWHRDEAEQVVKASPSASSVALRELLEPIQTWHQAGASTVYIPRIEIRLLERLYTFRKRVGVARFIERHPFLVPVLLEAYSNIENYFGLYPQVFLEVVSDPEVQGLVELFGYIATRLTPEEVGKQLQRFDQDWFLNQLPHVKGLLNFDVEFL